MSNMEWIHCNKCTAIGHRGGVFWFTSCGHIVCSNCMNQHGGPSPGRKAPCLACGNVASITEISRQMKPELLALFRPPRDLLRDLLAEATKRVKMTMDFQAGQRQALMVKLNEKLEKSHNYAKKAQAEITRRVEREKTMVAERSQLKAELEKAREEAERNGKMLAQREHELHRLQRKSPCNSSGGSNRRHSPYTQQKKHYNSGGGTAGTSNANNNYPNLNGQTPLTSLSFFGCAISTPKEQGFFSSSTAAEQHRHGHHSNSNNNMDVMFGGGGGSLMDPQQTHESPMIAGGGIGIGMGGVVGGCGPISRPTTPSLLGLHGPDDGRTPAPSRYF